MFCSSNCIPPELAQLTVGESVRNHPQPYPVGFCGFHKKKVLIHSQVSNIVVVICIQFLMPSRNSSTVARYVKSKTPAIHAPKISTCIINTTNPSAMKTKKKKKKSTQQSLAQRTLFLLARLPTTSSPSRFTIPSSLLPWAAVTLASFW